MGQQAKHATADVARIGMSDMAATAYWLLQRISHLAIGRYLIGFIGGLCFYAAIGPVVALSDHDPMSIGGMLAMGAGCGGLVGRAVALNRTE